MAYPFLYSVAASVLHKLDQCNLDEFGDPNDMQNDVEMLKGILNHLPSILETHDYDVYIFDIQKSVFGLHDLFNKQLHPSFKSSWSDLVGPLTKFYPQKGQKEENLLSSLSFPLPEIESQDVKANNIPLHLVRCLAYCALYPKGYRIVRETLVNLWMAEGFLDLKIAGSSSGSGSGDMELEDVGNRYFMELLSMGVFIKPKFGFGGNGTNRQAAITIHSCEIHPRMHKLACDLAQKEVWVIDSSETKKGTMHERDSFEGSMFGPFGRRNFPMQILHKDVERICTMYMALHEDLKAREWGGRLNLQRGLRTCMFFIPQIDEYFLGFSLHLSELQILDLSGTQFEELPVCIEQAARKLRYLAFSRNTLLERLDNIDWSSIQQLQTLAADGCVKLEKVNLEHTSHMRHLYYTSKETTLEVHTSTLRILQLSYCSELRSLSLSNFATFAVLRRLRIFECTRLESLPDSIDLLTHVEELVFHNCARLDLSYGRSMDSLPSLQYMELIGLPKLKGLPTGVQSGRALHYLMVANCKSLSSMDQVLQHLSPLQKLRVYDCPNLSIMPNVFQSLTALQSLDIRKCPKIAITSISNARKDQSPFFSHISEIIIDGHQLLDQTPGSSKEDVAIEPQIPSFGAQTDSFLPRNFPQFILNLESFPAINSSKGEEVSEAGSTDIKYGDEGVEFVQGASPDGDNEGMLFQKYKLKVPSRWLVLGLALKAIVNLRILQQRKLYCCLFPSDYEFERNTLFQLWLVRGFLPEHWEHPPPNEPWERPPANKHWEHLTNECFNRLLDEKCIYKSRTDLLTGITKYKVNVGKVTEFSNRFKIKDRYTLIKDEDTRVERSMSWHHFSAVSKNIDKVFQTLGELQTLKELSKVGSVLFLRDYGSSLKQIPSTFFKAHQYMQALDLSGSHISELPSSIGEMTDLRFLDLSFTLIERIPESIHLLKELQTLKLRGCKHLHKLPKGMKELVNLYHLDFDVLGQLTSMPKGLGSLTKLRTLSAFIVSKEEGCSLRELKDMNNLCGSLCISGLECASDGDAKEAAMPKKTHLTRLHLKWNESICYEEQDFAIAYNAVSHLGTNSSLLELQISYYPGSLLTSRFSDSNLESITLIGCAFKELFGYKEFPENLKHLNIYDVDRVKQLYTVGGSDHELETLTIDGMRSLNRWDGVNVGDFPCLRKISIKRCPELAKLPFHIYPDSLRYLEISHCQALHQWKVAKLPTSLETLMIDNCPLIKDSLSKNGRDWESIEHVPNIWIDMEDTDLLSEDESEYSGDSNLSLVQKNRKGGQ